MLTPSTNSFYFFPKASLCVHERLLSFKYDRNVHNYEIPIQTNCRNSPC
jgi:hypothetical protein